MLGMITTSAGDTQMFFITPQPLECLVKISMLPILSKIDCHLMRALLCGFCMMAVPILSGRPSLSMEVSTSQFALRMDTLTMLLIGHNRVVAYFPIALALLRAFERSAA